jgi:hypothetical protein
MTSVYQHKLPIWPTLSAAYGEWRRMLPALRPLVINAFLIVLAISVLDQFVPARLVDQEFFGTAITLAEAAVRAFLLTPILVAIHRFVILDEITKTYVVPLGEPAFRRFFAWLFTLEVLAGFPLDFLSALQALNITFAASTAGFVAALVVAVAPMVRLSILPPAIAVNATRCATWSGAGGYERLRAARFRDLLRRHRSMARDRPCGSRANRTWHRSDGCGSGHDWPCVRRHFANGLADFDGRHRLALVHRARDACAAFRSTIISSPAKFPLRKRSAMMWLIRFCTNKGSGK